MRKIHEIVSEIEGFLGVAEVNLDLQRLDALACEYFSQSGSEVHLDIWFRLFEAFPGSDGYGVFWTILHGIEAQPGCARFVLESVLRMPTHFPVMMVNRMLNAGIETVNGTKLLDVLRVVADAPQTRPDVRDDALSYLDR